MQYNVGELLSLLEKVAEKSGMTLKYASFKEIYSFMEEEMGNVPFNEEYLYKQVYAELLKKEKESFIGLKVSNINYILKFLEYSNYDQFRNHLNEPIHPSLKNCVGTWYSYVRCNSGQPYILRSPVRIYEDGKEVIMHLKGKSRTFIGKLKFEGNCIYCRLESNEDKNIHIVFKVGFAKDPQVLQGVFSAMSSEGDPISGREVLIRQTEKFVSLVNERRSIKAYIKSEKETENALGSYFQESERNILKISKTSTFDWEDLKG